MSQQRPHVSAAIQSLRPMVTAAAIGVIACATVQMLVFGFVHFTEVRWEKSEQPVTTQSLTVVTGPARESAQAAPGGAIEQGGRRGRRITEVQAAAMRQVPSRWAPVLQQFSDFAVAIGVVSTLALGVFVAVGTVIGGGGAVPGVEKAVKALAWATMLALFAIPWQDALASIPFGGVFGDYQTMVLASEAVDAGNAAVAPLLAAHLLLPLAALVVAGVVVVSFRAGVERGVIVTSVSELDEALDREMEHIKQRGIGSNVGGGRTIGTLNRAIGDQQPESGPVPMAKPAAAAAADPDADPAKGRSWVSPADRRMNQPTSGNPLRRLV